MHIVIDMQGAQGGSRNRGMGRYTEGLTLALIRLARGKHHVSIILSAAFPDTITPIRQQFYSLVDANDFHIWEPLLPCHAHNSANDWRRNASIILYKEFLRALSPDVVLVASLFEGFDDDVVIGINDRDNGLLTAVVLYDLIPYIHPKAHLENPAISAWYFNCLHQLRRADLLLSISESSREEAIGYLDWVPEQVTNISSAVDERFHVIDIPSNTADSLYARYGLNRPYIMCTSSIDIHKNIKGLIAAFADLPACLRQRHQLALVCNINDHEYKRLMGFALRKGLVEGDLVFTGFVPDDDLVALYNLCTLFVFPSWHEGFGLPVLEAMTCGAPTIASNCSSLPEVIGWDEALFNPLDSHDLCRAIKRGLDDNHFRKQLKEHGLKQAKKFSWESTAIRALEALEGLYKNGSTVRRDKVQQISYCSPIKPLLAYVSPLQSAPSGIADYSAGLLPELAAHYEIDVVVEQVETVSDPWVLGNARQRSLAWFDAHAHEYDRILYHFGNSPFHQHMFALIERHAGVVILHDFFLSGVSAHRDITGAEPGFWARSLLHSHGWKALEARFTVEDTADVAWAYPCNLGVLQRALGIIVHSEFSRRLAERWYGTGFAGDWSLIPLLRVPMRSERSKARNALCIADDDFLVCAFGRMGQIKLNLKLIEAWNASVLASNPKALLVFVGQEAGNEYGEEIRALIQAGKGHVQITSRVDEVTYKRYLMAADVAVQLRTLSRGETSAAVLDCMNFGLPTIVNAHGSMADLPHEAVLMLPDELTVTELREALEHLKTDMSLRRGLGERAQAHVRTHHQPRACAAQYAQAIEGYYAKAELQAQGVVRAVRRLGAPPSLSDLVALAERMAQIYPPRKSSDRQLFIDVSELHLNDAKTGIQRVVRSVLHELLRKEAPEGFRVEPVFATHERGYRYARRYTARFLGLGEVPLDDSPIFARAGDVFWGLDWQADIVPRLSAELNGLRLRGVRVVFTVYDLLPILLPETFNPGMSAAHSRWLTSLAASADGLLCISRTVMQRTREWLEAFGPQKGHTLKLGWAHLGADVIELVENDPRPPLTARQCEQLDAIARYPSFLMVGTLEPRKRQMQVLAAFELLWNQGVEANLVIVGKQGWLVEELAAHLHSHPLRERHLFWLESTDDAMLEQVYVSCACLIAASLDEGYGLPLVEAARHKLPILARDIPVFREVAGEHAQYFSAQSPHGLAKSVTEWLRLYHQDRHPKSDAIPWATWAQATHEMLDLVLHDGFQDQWVPREDETLVARYWGSDPCFGTPSGRRKGQQVFSTGSAGYLLHGPYLGMERGRYVARIFGTAGPFGFGRACAEVCIEGGTKSLAEQALSETETPDGNVLAELAFVLNEAVNGLEIRVIVDEQSDLSVSALEIRRADRSADPGSVVPASRAHRGEVGRQWCYWWATHDKMHTQVGYANGRSLYTRSQSGALVFGPYIPVAAGAYRVTLIGEAEVATGAEVRVASARGEVIHATSSLSGIGHGGNQVLCTVDFVLDAFGEDLEIQLFVDAQTCLRLDGATLAESASPRQVADSTVSARAHQGAEEVSEPAYFKDTARHAKPSADRISSRKAVSARGYPAKVRKSRKKKPYKE